MSSRTVTGVLAAAGGACWIVKTLLIWASGGTNTTGGAVGLLFLAGTAFLATAVGRWAWGATAERAMPLRILAVVCALVGLFVAVNLPILVGYALLPGSWLAEEIGVFAVAILAIVAGMVGIRSHIRGPA